jgi:Domain of unknown function (DUF5658)
MSGLQSDAQLVAENWRAERRFDYDRRCLSWRTFAQGCITPRRRLARRHGEHDMLVDWHEPHLLFLALSILLLSVADAFLTLTLLTHGAEEANPVLYYVLHEYPSAFAWIKLSLTAVGVVVLVAMARTTVFRRIRVSSIMHSCLAVYLTLIGYEFWMLTHLG